MSLFKLRHLWIQSFPDEEFDEHHVSIGSIDDLPAIALASFSGRLRVYWVLPDKKFEALLIYDNTFQSPVISVEFVSPPKQKSKNGNTIGVLLFRKFLYITLRKNYEKNTFESKQTQIAVQPAFAIEPQTPSILTLNSSIQHLNPTSIQPFKISSPIYPFARGGSYLYYADGEELVAMKNSTQQWRVIVGPMRSLHLLKSTIVVIGDNALWEVVETSIQKTKVMEQDISCGTIISKDTDYNIVVANFSNQILIYTSSYQLIWACKADEVPIRICICSHKALFGAMVLLGQEGSLSISYLGSELPQSSIEPLNQQIDMQQVQSQTQKLLSQLRAKQDKQLQNTGAIQSQQQNRGDVKLNLSVTRPHKNKQIILPNQKQSGEYCREDGILWSCQLECVIKAERQGINDVLLIMNTPSNIHCIQNNRKIIAIKNSEKFVFQLVVSCQKFPHSNSISVTLRYENADKRRGTSVITQTCNLPLDFQCRFKSTELEQKPVNKIVFKAQNDLPPFSEIFNEFQSLLKSSKNMTVTLPNGVSVSMGYNKNNTKVKVQSNFFSGLCFIFVVFADRFRKLVQSKKVSNNQLSIDDIPLQQFFTLMKQHYTLRETFKQRSADLETKCEQFRNVEKKLIIKMKQKASSINNVDKLLEYAYRRLITAADLYEQTNVEIEKVTHNLQVAITFVLQLLFMKSKATQKCRQKVMGIIGFQRESVSLQYGWEQKIMANSAHFLNKKYNYTTDKYTFDQLYKTALWVISKINSGEWN